MRSLLVLTTLMVLSIFPCTCTRCFLQPSVGGVPNESSSPLLCTLLPTSSKEIPVDVSDADGVLAADNFPTDDDASDEGIDSDERDVDMLRANRGQPQHNFLRFGRDIEHRFLRFGREPQHNFMRFGRGSEPQHTILRFGRSTELEDSRNRYDKATLPMFMRLGRGPEHVFMRFGRQQNPGHKFMRFGRKPPVESPAQQTPAEKRMSRK